MFFHCQEGSLVDHRAYKPYTLVGPPALRLVLDPLAVLFLDNRLYITITTLNIRVMEGMAAIPKTTFLYLEIACIII